jgi:DNA-binding transcriptional LysR family regulator
MAQLWVRPIDKKSEMFEPLCQMELHNVDLNKIATFLTIAELGSVTAAATQLGLTRSAVSHSLRAIEEQLDVPLFHRVGRGLVLTNEGTLLKQAAADVRSRMTVALEEVRGLAREVRGPVRLGLFLGFSRFRLAEAVDAFTGQHPNTEVRISFAPQAWLIAQLLAGKLDMTLSLRPTGQQASSIRSEKLTVRPLVLVIRASAKGAPRTFEKLCGLSYVDYYRSAPLIDRWTRHHFGGRIVPRERIRAWVASTDLALELALRGNVGAVVPADVAESFQRARQLTVVRATGGPLQDHLWLNDLGAAGQSRAAKEFRGLLRRSLTN